MSELTRYTLPEPGSNFGHKDYYLASDVDAHMAALEIFLEKHLSDEAKEQLSKLEWKS